MLKSFQMKSITLAILAILLFTSVCVMGSSDITDFESSLSEVEDALGATKDMDEESTASTPSQANPIFLEAVEEEVNNVLGQKVADESNSEDTSDEAIASLLEKASVSVKDEMDALAARKNAARDREVAIRNKIAQLTTKLQSVKPKFSFRTCTASGDPHYDTFDGIHHDTMVDGWFTMAKNDVINVQSFSQLGCMPKNIPNTCIRSTVIQITPPGTDQKLVVSYGSWPPTGYEQNVIIKDSTGKQVDTPRNKFTTDKFLNGKFEVYRQGDRIAVRAVGDAVTDPALSISASIGTYYFSLILPEVAPHTGKTNGLCGFYNGGSKNEITKVFRNQDGSASMVTRADLKYYNPTVLNWAKTFVVSSTNEPIALDTKAGPVSSSDPFSPIPARSVANVHKPPPATEDAKARQMCEDMLRGKASAESMPDQIRACMLDAANPAVAKTIGKALVVAKKAIKSQGKRLIVREQKQIIKQIHKQERKADRAAAVSKSLNLDPLPEVKKFSNPNRLTDDMLRKQIQKENKKVIDFQSKMNATSDPAKKTKLQEKFDKMSRKLGEDKKKLENRNVRNGVVDNKAVKHCQKRLDRLRNEITTTKDPVKRASLKKREATLARKVHRLQDKVKSSSDVKSIQKKADSVKDSIQAVKKQLQSASDFKSKKKLRSKLKSLQKRLRGVKGKIIDAKNSFKLRRKLDNATRTIADLKTDSSAARDRDDRKEFNREAEQLKDKAAKWKRSIDSGAHVDQREADLERLTKIDAERKNLRAKLQKSEDAAGENARREGKRNRLNHKMIDRMVEEMEKRQNNQMDPTYLGLRKPKYENFSRGGASLAHHEELEHLKRELKSGHIQEAKAIMRKLDDREGLAELTRLEKKMDPLGTKIKGLRHRETTATDNVIRHLANEKTDTAWVRKKLGLLKTPKEVYVGRFMTGGPHAERIPARDWYENWQEKMWKREKDYKWRSKHSKSYLYRKALQSRIRVLWKEAKIDTVQLLTRVLKTDLFLEAQFVPSIPDKWQQHLKKWGEHLRDIKEMERIKAIPRQKLKKAIQMVQDKTFQSHDEQLKRMHQRDVDATGLPPILSPEFRKKHMWGCIKCYDDKDAVIPALPIPEFDQTYWNFELDRHFFDVFDRVVELGDTKHYVIEMDKVMRSEYVMSKLSPAEKATIVKQKLLQFEVELSHYQNGRVQILPTNDKVPVYYKAPPKWPDHEFRIRKPTMKEEIKTKVPVMKANYLFGPKTPASPDLINSANQVIKDAWTVYFDSHKDGAPLDSDN